MKLIVHSRFTVLILICIRPSQPRLSLHTHRSLDSLSPLAYISTMPQIPWTKSRGDIKAHAVCTGLDMNDAVHKWSNDQNQQFRNRGGSDCEGYMRRNYYCTRGECRRKKGAEPRRFFDEKNTACPASLLVYQPKNEKLVYIYKKGEHNHEPGGKYLNLVPEARERLVRIFMRDPHMKPKRYLAGRSPEAPSNDNDKDEDARIETQSNINVPRSENLLLTDLQRARNKARSKQRLLRKGEGDTDSSVNIASVTDS